MALENINALIPLQAGRNLPQIGPDWNAVDNNQRTAIAVQNQQQMMQGQNALRALYSNPQNYDQATMKPTPQAWAQLMATSPATGMDLQNNLAAIAVKKLQTSNLQSSAMQHWQTEGNAIAKQALDAYKSVLQSGGTEEAAIQEGQAIYSKGGDELKASGMPDALKQRWLPNFDPHRIMNNLMTVEQQAAVAKPTIRTDYGHTPPIEYKMFPDGHMESMGGTPYTPTGVGEPKGTEAKLFIGQIDDGKGGKKEIRYRYGAMGAIDEQNNPVDTTKITGVHTVDSKNAGTWQILNDPNNNNLPYRYNAMTGEATTLDKKPYIPQGASRLGQGQKPSPFSDSDVDYWATVLNNGGSFPPGLARTAAGSDFVQKVMAKMGKSGDPGKFISDVATVKADSGSLRNMTKMADAATSFERTASQNFDLALNLAKGDPESKLPEGNPARGRPAAVPTDWGPFVNRWIMEGEKFFGNTDVPPYVTAMLTGANEYAKIMSGSTGAQGSTVDSRKEAAELFSPYLSKGQIDRVVAVAKADMANRKQSLYGQIDDIKGRLHSAGSGEPTATQGQATPAVPTGQPASPQQHGGAQPGTAQPTPGNAGVPSIDLIPEAKRTEGAEVLLSPDNGVTQHKYRVHNGALVPAD